MRCICIATKSNADATVSKKMLMLQLSKKREVGRERKI
jgi:hypothetical protein